MESWTSMAMALALVLIGAAVVLPRVHRARKANNENQAIGALKAIANAQTLYREGDKDGDGTLAYAPR